MIVVIFIVIELNWHCLYYSASAVILCTCLPCTTGDIFESIRINIVYCVIDLESCKVFMSSEKCLLIIQWASQHYSIDINCQQGTAPCFKKKQKVNQESGFTKVARVLAFFFLCKENVDDIFL